MKYNFDNVIQRKNTASIKWDNVSMIAKGKDVMPFWIADTDFKAPNEVIEALHKRVDHGVFGYTGNTSTIVPTIIDWIKKRNNWEINADWIAYTPGVLSAIGCIIDTQSNENDNILLQTPIYPPFLAMPVDNKRKVVESKLILKDNRYEIDFEDFEEKAKTAKIFLLSNPHNPSGRVFTREELERMGQICVKNHVIIVSDEIHSDVIFKGNKHVPIASISEEIRNITITCMSTSKTFSLAGLVASIAIIPNKEIKEKFDKYMMSKHLSVNLLGKTALEAAYKYGEDYLTDLKEYIESNRNYVIDFMSKNTPKIKPIHSEGTFLMWFDCREMNLNNDELQDFFINAGVALNPGQAFGSCGSGFARFNIGCSRETLIEGLERIKKAYK